jgi:hypothetical protein
VETVTIENRLQFCEDMHYALLDQLADHFAMMSTAEFLVADRTLRRAVDVLFLESVTAASSMLH